mmetsp:Transcript_14740/g.30387  ORF Transcript_14740/g.30387 Transcript_14740/m.30387 type:complete len:105 (+) Transcript_14740:60-374(+)
MLPLKLLNHFQHCSLSRLFGGDDAELENTSTVIPRDKGGTLPTPVGWNSFPHNVTLSYQTANGFLFRYVRLCSQSSLVPVRLSSPLTNPYASSSIKHNCENHHV